jgi:hypothetical protein
MTARSVGVMDTFFPTTYTNINTEDNAGEVVVFYPYMLFALAVK